MVSRNHVVAPALLVEAERTRAVPGCVVVGDPKRDRGAHPREAVDEHAEQRAVAEACDRRDVDAIEERAGLRSAQHRGLAGLDDVLRATHGARGG